MSRRLCGFATRFISARDRLATPGIKYGAPDGARRQPLMQKLTTERLRAPLGNWIAIGEESEIGPAGARGSCGEARWSLRFDSREPELRHLSPDLLYRLPLPRTKLTSPAPVASFDGAVELGERGAIELRGWSGMVGHNWGSEHAERWIWLHGLDFEKAPGAWIDVSLGACGSRDG